MPDLSPEELLRLQMDASWQSFTDEQPLGAMAVLEALDPNTYGMVRTAFKAGFTRGWLARHTEEL